MRLYVSIGGMLLRSVLSLFIWGGINVINPKKDGKMGRGGREGGRVGGREEGREGGGSYSYKTHLQPKKLNPLRAKWSMESALISGFCSALKGNESL